MLRAVVLSAALAQAAGFASHQVQIYADNCPPLAAVDASECNSDQAYPLCVLPDGVFNAELGAGDFCVNVGPLVCDAGESACLAEVLPAGGGRRLLQGVVVGPLYQVAVPDCGNRKATPCACVVLEEKGQDRDFLAGRDLATHPSFPLALSGDGTTAAAGAFMANSWQGYAKVFEGQQGLAGWSQHGRTLAGGSLGEHAIGTVVQLNYDGTRLAVQIRLSPQSKLYVYDFNPTANDWHKTHEFDANAGVMNDAGTEVAITCCGSIRSGNVRARVHKYSNVNSDWSPYGLEIDLKDSFLPPNDMYKVMSISGDGNVIALASASAYEGTSTPGTASVGRVRMLKHHISGNWDPDNDIVGAHAGDLLGASVSLDFYGSMAAIGAPGFNNGRGRVQVYNGPDALSPFTTWTISRPHLDGRAGEQDRFGQSCDLSFDGKHLVVGAPSSYGSGGRGSVMVYSWEGHGYSQLGKPIAGNPVGARLGQTVKISDDGKTVAASALEGPPTTGATTGNVCSAQNCDRGRFLVMDFSHC